MSTTLTGDEARREIRERLWKAIERDGSLGALAHRWKVSSGYLSDVFRGRRPAGPKILSKIDMMHLADVPTESHPLATGDVAQMFGVTRWCVKNWCVSGKLQCRRIPGIRSQLRFRAQDVATFARSHGRHDVAEKIEGRVSL